MNKTIFSIAICLLGLIMAQQCPAQITRSHSVIFIRGDDGDNRVNISSLDDTWGPGWFSVSLRRGNGDWPVRYYLKDRNNIYIDCDLGSGSNYFSNRTTLDSIIEVSGNGTNTIFCGDGDDFYMSRGNSRDLVLGGDGDDSLSPGDGWDWVLGEEGDDIIFDSDAGFHVSLFGTAPGGDGKVDWLSGGTGRDTFLLGTEDRLTDLSPEDEIFAP